MNGTSTNWRAVLLMGLWGAVTGTPAAAQNADLANLSLQALLDTEVTSVSRKEQSLSRTAAAVHIITQEDIRRSGARTVPELLRLVPGFAVARIDATNWAVTARGFNGLYANKLLVLIDGRSVYSLLFAGVHWEMQNVPIADVDRIEVVRGPGGSLWGSNAVNGIINIITKAADQTQGGLVSGSSGSTLQTAGDLRYGGALGATTHYRVFAKYSGYGTGTALGGFSDPDAGNATVAGARLDWHDDLNRVTVQGSVQDALVRHVRTHSLTSAPWKTLIQQSTDFTDRNAVVSWTRSASSRLELSLQGYYQDYTRRQHFGTAGTVFDERWRIADVEARQKYAVGRHEVVAGLGYRVADNRLTNAYNLAFLPASERGHLLTAFAQDEIELAGGVRLTPGAKLEYNTLTGTGVQPSLRVTWAASRNHATWGAVSRSLRTPSRTDRGMRIPVSISPGPAGSLMVVMLQGTPEVRDERLLAFEGGHRAQFGRLSLDIAAYRHDYADLIGASAGAPQPGTFADRPVRIVPLWMTNGTGGHGYGIESTAAVRAADWWTLSAASSWMRFRSHVDSGAGASVARQANVPEHQLSLRSYVNLPRGLEVNTFLYRVGAVEGGSQAYTSATARLVWRPRRPIELSIGAENLFHDGGFEFVDSTGVQSVPTRTTVTAGFSWAF